MHRQAFLEGWKGRGGSVDHLLRRDGARVAEATPFKIVTDEDLTIFCNLNISLDDMNPEFVSPHKSLKCVFRSFHTASAVSNQIMTLPNFVQRLKINSLLPHMQKLRIL